MNYKETLFFVAKCLTIFFEKKNKKEIEEQLKNEEIDWDAVVKLSTEHYVFPALYCNLKRANFLQYLPEELVNYMAHITTLNRERNQQIIDQAKEINQLLLENNITPIFLKGTGNLLEGLYEDIAERMVGDIDFLVAKEDCNKAFEILNNSGYNKLTELYDDFRHLPRLTSANKIAAVEIHREMIKDKKASFFNLDSIKSTVISKNNCKILSPENQIKLTIFSKFINDDAYILKSIGLRPAYDTLCIFYASKINLQLIEEKKMKKELNTGLRLYATILDKPKKMFFFPDDENKKYVDKIIKSLDKNNSKNKLYTRYLFISERFKILVKALYKKNYFNFVLSKVFERNWYKRRFGI
ncbi:nucleotidyltransferase family protein [uncultured Polaribacter sp.]|uniref:nucleotidyltransferase domain-containing protein n=1 Tax=uncultured Polaribacter sp. TaxID=174711 RepID=UPI0026124D1A|nr:nucleotidyltransferase family protein [uncultured Polaribacter sp.]